MSDTFVLNSDSSFDNNDEFHDVYSDENDQITIKSDLILDFNIKKKFNSLQEQDNDDEELFFDVISSEIKTEENEVSLQNQSRSLDTCDYKTKTPQLEMSKENNRFTALEFLQNSLESESEYEDNDNDNGNGNENNKRETFFEFLTSTNELRSVSEISSLSRLQIELLEEECEPARGFELDGESEIKSEPIKKDFDSIEEESITQLDDDDDNNNSLSNTNTNPEHDRLKNSFLHVSARPLPLPRDSLLRRANPLAGFFKDRDKDAERYLEQEGYDQSDGDSMISDLTFLTTRTNLSEDPLNLSLKPSTSSYLLNSSVKSARRYKAVVVKAKSKQKSEFGNLFLIQELNKKPTNNVNTNLLNTNSNSKIIQSPVSSLNSNSTNNSTSTDSSKAIFVLKFSPDGHFLAAAGAEGTIKIFSLININSQDVQLTPPRLATIFENEPIRILRGHSAEILACDWSSNNFLLTASMDKTVRLWHHSRSDVLGIFQHLDYVTSVAFHPQDSRLFLSGSLDCKLRLWSIQDRSILNWNELPPGNFITAVAFTASGKSAIAGTSGGTALIFDTEGLRYNTQILVRSTKKSSGKKITGIEAVPNQFDKDKDEKILISSNDSRIRMYNLRDKNVLFKYKGHQNSASQLRASLTTDSAYLISGSEDCRIYIWNADGKFQKKGLGSFFTSFRKDHIDSYESFKAHSNPVTAAIFAPNCVTSLLKSLQLRPSENSLQSTTNTLTEGKIIVTADVTGQIKVFENNSKLVDWLK